MMIKENLVIRLLVFFIILNFCLLVTGGQGKIQAAELDKVSFRMNWYWSGIHAPFFLAQERGYYKANGIEINIQEGRGSATTVKLVDNKSDDFGLADAGTTMIAIGKGVSIKCVAAINRADLAVIFLKKTEIKTAKDIEEKSIAVTAGDSLHQMFPAVIAANKLEEKKIKFLFMDPAAKPVAVMEGRADALLGGLTDQPVIMAAKGFPTSALTFAELGVDTVGLAILAHHDTIKNRPDLVRRFLAATLKGLEDARKDPEAAVSALMKYQPRDATIFKNSLMVLFTILYPEIGKAKPEDWNKTLELLKKYRGLETDKTADYFYTNEFLPK